MPQRLLNKVAVVTGAGGPWGRAIAERFLEEGAKVVVFGGNRGRLEELAVRAAPRVLVFDGDVTAAQDLDALVATTVRRFGDVDVLVPLAEDVRHASLAVCTPEVVSEIFGVNFEAALQIVRVFDRHLKPGASIVFLGTPAAMASRAGLGPFAASKAALASLGRTLAVELSPRRIRVNCVAPVRINPSQDAPAAGGPGQSGEHGIPRSEPVAEAVLFLASNDAAGITGQEIVVEG